MVDGRRSAPPGCAKHRLWSAATRAGGSAADAGEEESDAGEEDSDLRVARQAEHSLTHDVALDLGRAAPDRLGAREEERRLHRADGVPVASTLAHHAGPRLVVTVAAEDLRVHPDDVERELHDLSVVL